MAAPTTDAHATASPFLRRMLRASLLRADLYEEVEADRSATGQALAVVVLSAVALGIGSIENGGTAGIPWQIAVDVVFWLAWAWLSCWIGTRWLPTPETHADVGQLLRTLGFASAPGVLRVAMLLPHVGLAVFAACKLWMLAAMVVAVRQALDYRSTARAVAVCAIGFPLYLISLVLSLLLLGPWPM